MPILGTVSYVPDPKYSFTRRYITQVAFGFGPGVIRTGSDNEFVFTPGVGSPVHVVANLKPTLWGTRSDMYQLDSMLVDWYLLVDPSPTPQPLNLTIQFAYDFVVPRPTVYFFIAGWSQWYYYPIPPSPPGYWLPDLP